MTVPCRVTTQSFCILEVIEGQANRLPEATSLNRQGVHDKCTFTGVQERYVEVFQPLTSCEVADVSITHETEGNTAPEHLEEGYKTAKENCEQPPSLRPRS